MKKIIILLGIFTAFASQAQIKHALFIGNSYTGVNNLPLLVKNVALSLGDTLSTDQNIPGGYQLIQHSTNTTSLAKINSRNWDFVILQEQSQKPSFPPSQVATDVYPYAYQLNNTIKSNYSCTETVFYMTWGRKNGDASNCASYPPICTYAGMQQRLRESYMEMADSNKATVSPVGVAWNAARDSFPAIELYSPDESHPSLHGSYLTACVFYATLYQKSPIGSTYLPAGISNSEAFYLQTIASRTVLDSLPQWRIGANLPIANFNYSGDPTVSFANSSTNGDTYYWDFGDGNTSTIENPTHTYLTNGNYPVKLITFSADSCFSDTIIQNVDFTHLNIENSNSLNQISIYPNPANNYFEIATNLKYSSITINDITGKQIQVIPNKKRIDISKFNNGIYFVNIYNNKERLKTFKLMKR